MMSNLDKITEGGGLGWEMKSIEKQEGTPLPFYFPYYSFAFF